MANRTVVILSSVRSHRQSNLSKSALSLDNQIRLASAKALPGEGRGGSVIKNMWRWIKYYRRRKKIYLRDGTVLMPRIRLYDWLDFANGDQAAGRRLR
ncbi:MAG TPA: hypothetical protein VEI52_14240 [Terriglobales bacterium]|nr:hypothetical protein [Terriglobales bacterium]